MIRRLVWFFATLSGMGISGRRDVSDVAWIVWYCYTCIWSGKTPSRFEKGANTPSCAHICIHSHLHSCYSSRHLRHALAFAILLRKVNSEPRLPHWTKKTRAMLFTKLSALRPACSFAFEIYLNGATSELALLHCIYGLNSKSSTRVAKTPTGGSFVSVGEGVEWSWSF